MNQHWPETHVEWPAGKVVAVVGGGSNDGAGMQTAILFMNWLY